MKFDSMFFRSESASKLRSLGRRLFRTVFVTLALVVLWLLVYSHFVFGRTSCQSRTMDLSCPGGNDRRLPRSVPSLPRGPFFMFLRPGPPYRALLMAAAADLTNIGSIGGSRVARCWPWRYFESQQL